MKTFETMLVALAAAAMLGTSAPAGAVRGPTPRCTPLPPERIGVQLYSFADALLAKRDRDGAVAADGLTDSFAAIRRAGFRRVERFGATLGAERHAYRAALRQAGLLSVASHDSIEGAGWAAALDEARVMGQRFIGSGNFGKPGLDSLDDVLATAANLEARGREASARGLRFYVHNHAEEFNRQYSYDIDGNGRPRRVSAWEIIAARTSPRHVSFELDIYWARKGLGIDRPEALLALLRRYQSRILLLHVKDMGTDGEITDLGHGIIDWPSVFAAAGPGVRYYLWEYDRAPEPARSAAIAYRFMRCTRPAS